MRLYLNSHDPDTDKDTYKFGIDTENKGITFKRFTYQGFWMDEGCSFMILAYKYFTFRFGSKLIPKRFYSWSKYDGMIHKVLNFKLFYIGWGESRDDLFFEE